MTTYLDTQYSRGNIPQPSTASANTQIISKDEIYSRRNIWIDHDIWCLFPSIFLLADEYIRMFRCEVLDKYTRDRTIDYGAEIVNDLVSSIDISDNHRTTKSQYTINYLEFQEGSQSRVPQSMNFNVILGGDGANFRVVKAMATG